MAQIFQPSANKLVKITIAVSLLLPVGGLWMLDRIHKSPAVRYTHVPLDQPVPYSHELHVGMGIDCRYCHTTVEESSFATVPPTRVCMNCHSVILKESPRVEAVRDSWESGESIPWTRVYDLPDHVYFDHSIHVNKGIGCTTCHGAIDAMATAVRDKPLFMQWCLECHRAPEKFIRPREYVFNVDYTPPENQLEQGRQLVKKYNVQSAERLTDCWICHR